MRANSECYILSVRIELTKWIEPLIVTIVVDTIVSSYMLFDPPEWIIETMQLTFISRGFAFWLFALATSTFLLSWVTERKFFPLLSRAIGHLKTRLRPGTVSSAVNIKCCLMKWKHEPWFWIHT